MQLAGLPECVMTDVLTSCFRSHGRILNGEVGELLKG